MKPWITCATSVSLILVKCSTPILCHNQMEYLFPIFPGNNCSGFQSPYTCGCGQPCSVHQTLVSIANIKHIRHYLVLKVFGLYLTGGDKSRAGGKRSGCGQRCSVRRHGRTDKLQLFAGRLPRFGSYLLRLKSFLTYPVHSLIFNLF